jgi:ParB/RepB/Spo0J family partition protein
MSAVQTEASPSQLLQLPVSSIDPNENNPRLVFPQDELDRLAESIDLEGILVPIVVYPKGDRYVLVDGERRFKCAQILGLNEVPALVTSERPEHDVLVQMFNIHLIREPWRDMPTAKALAKLADQLMATGKEPTDKALRDLTGLSIERVRRLRYVMELPQEWQDFIDEGSIPLNFFWELKRNVIDPLASKRPELLNELGSDTVMKAIVEKRQDGVISDTISLRKLRPLINFAAEDAAERPDDKSFLDDTIRDLVKKPELSIDEVYEDTVQTMVEADKLERRTRSMLASFERLLHRARTTEERKYVEDIGREFVTKLNAVLQTK